MTSPAAVDAMLSLGEAFFGDHEFDAARAIFDAALKLRDGDPRAHFGLKLICDVTGDAKGALRHWQLAFARPFVTAHAYKGTGKPIDVLLMLSGRGGNMVTAPLLDNTIVRLFVLIAEGYIPEMELPSHHLLFNGIGDPDRSLEALETVGRVLDRAGSAAINDPARVRATGRVAVAERLAAIPGAVTAQTVELSRDEMTAEALTARGFTFPLLVRSPGFHTGEHFERVERADDLAAIVAALPGDELFAIAFHDTSNAEGAYRKYRVMFIGGRLYPLHLAISSLWKVHYFSADMADRPEHRFEEAAFLDDMPAVLGERVMATLEAIRSTLALDYGGIDFSVDENGDVVVFEANATMVILPVGDDERFAYRIPAVARVHEAVHAMLLEKAALGGFVPA